MIPQTLKQIKSMPIGKEWEYMESVTVFFPKDQSQLAKTYMGAYELGLVILTQRKTGDKVIANGKLLNLYSYRAKRVMTQNEEREAKMLDGVK